MEIYLQRVRVSGESRHGNPFTGTATKLSWTCRVPNVLLGVDQDRAIPFEYLDGHIGGAAGKHVLAGAVTSASCASAATTEEVGVEYVPSASTP